MEHKKEPNQIKETDPKLDELRRRSDESARWAEAAAKAEARLRALEAERERTRKERISDIPEKVEDRPVAIKAGDRQNTANAKPPVAAEPLTEKTEKSGKKGRKAEKKAGKRAAKEAEKAKKKEAKTRKELEKEKKAQKKREKRKEKRAEKGDGIFRRAGCKIVNGAAATVEFHDRVQGACDRFFAAIGISLVKEYDSAVRRYRRSRRQIYASFFLMVIITCAMLLVFEHFTAYQYAYNGRVLGYVKDQNDVVNVLDVAGNKLSSSNKANIKFTANDNVTMNKVAVFNKDMDIPDQVVNKLTYMTDIEVSAIAICQDGKVETIVEDQSAADAVLKRIKANYSVPDEGMKITKSEFKRPVETKTISVMLTSVQSKGDALKELTDGGEIEITHLVGEGETIRSIAKKFDVSTTDIYLKDSGNPAAKIESGDRVVIRKTVDPLTVVTVESGTTTEVIPYETEEQESADLYIGDTYVQQQGEDGRQSITGKITKENGKEVSRDIKKKEVLKESVKQIVLKGTKEKPKTAPTGTFAMPIRGATITSEFGQRWGRMHEGIDFGAPVGTPIYASDGGTVSRTGVYGGYGISVDINHGSGYMTRYGHMSRLVVSEGDQVYQGQLIGYSGNTGRSTGPHLHFEIRINGTAMNPRNYL